MSIDNAQKFRDAFAALFAPDMNATALALADSMLQQELSYSRSQPVDAAASTAGTRTFDQSTSFPMVVKAFKIITSGNVTADDTNYATVALVYNDGAGGSDTTIASKTTKITGGTGNLTAGIAYSFAITAANARIPAGSQVQVKVTKAGTGVSLPVSTFELKCAPSA